MKPLLGKALQAGYRSEKRELRDRLNATNPKTPKPTAPKTPSRAAALVKAMTTPRTRLPLNGDALLDIGSTLLKAQRIDAETAAKLASAVSLSQVPDALMQTLREACHG
ncbi:hypothetical protein [Paraburkholderia rhynchosiae]|nr:hypothetical protein [Paraburkholderia rhynchosiae]